MEETNVKDSLPFSINPYMTPTTVRFTFVTLLPVNGMASEQKYWS